MKNFFLFVFIAFALNTYGQSTWNKTSSEQSDDIVFVESHMPSYYQLFSIDLNEITTSLQDAPDRSRVTPASPEVILEFPTREGTFEAFSMLEAPMLDPILAAKFPMIKTYVGIGIEDRSAILYLSIGTNGLHVMIRKADHPTLYIDPFTRTRDKYIVYSKGDLPVIHHANCEFHGEEPIHAQGEEVPSQRNITDGLMREYNLVVATTIEYSDFHLMNQGIGSGEPLATKKAAVLSAITTTINRVKGLYETELGVTFVLNANQDDVIFIDSDNFTNDDTSILIGESQTEIDNAIGNANYDVGHTFSTSGGGLASLGGICTVDGFGATSRKARAVTGSSNPIGDAFDVDFVAHEMGHHFGANHSYNGDGVENCTTSNSSTAAETGSGTTIMAYAGICGSLNVQSNSDDYFHIFSLQEINNRLTNAGDFTHPFYNQCSSNTSTGNQEPVANAGSDYTIPNGTAFVLSGSATDGDGDAMTYCWDQIDIEQPNVYPLVSTTTTGPLYRSQIPSSSTDRYMPKFATVFGGSLQTTWEVTPTVGRNLNFSFTARDNRADGGQNTSDDMLVTVSGVAGPFTVTSQASEVMWSTGESQTITWNVAGTTANGVNTANVEITLVDENNNVLSTLLASTPNDGSENITVPNVTNSNARVKVAAIGNIFYALNGATIAVNTTPAYCNTLCASTGSVAFADGTTYVEFNTITNASSGAPAYSDFTGSVAPTNVQQGQSYNLTIRVNTDGNFTEVTRVWIDWNRNCDFTDAGEEYDLGSATDVTDGPTSNSPLSIMVPAGAELGDTRMRVGSAYDDGSPPTSCETGYLGEVEDYTINIIASVGLPVELLAFSASAIDGRSIQLDWRTASEINNAGFELERSQDGIQFQSIAWIGGYGNTSTTHAYQYIDKDVRQNQRYYYRLKQVDFDNNFQYSKIRSSIIRSQADQITVYPNPVSSKVYIQMDSIDMPDGVVFELFDLLGRKVLAQSLTNSNTSFAVDYLPKGVYSYRISNQQKTIKSDKLLVN